ncbi:TetR family transcriptional regulator [Stenotrophomonas sp. SY1]|uniref:TetR family transcriptional regulator n=1 Tax=Stenotrophomonas sp. SY1 TaxID=477235 RepID=UPI001E4209EB|nr:TetR family transcriptional regulator [Stenotrophomonas sp. SY1]MCD9088233.1 TetR family transcriptional regulator [Stenotrophomonas sp. SY1]
MARKTKEEAQATREGILDAALACFHENGVANTSLAAIGERAGYTRGAVYWHFKNKTEVLEAMINRERIPFIERLRHAYSPHRNTPILDLRSVMLISLSELANEPHLRDMMEIMLRNDLSAESQAMQQMQQDSIEEEMAIFRRAFERARELGQLRDGVDTAVVSRILHAGMTGVLYSAMLEPKQFDLERDSREVMDALLAYYVKPGVFTPGADPKPLPPADPDPQD